MDGTSSMCAAQQIAPCLSWHWLHLLAMAPAEAVPDVQLDEVPVAVDEAGVRGAS